MAKDTRTPARDGTISGANATAMKVGQLFAEFNDSFFAGRLPLYRIELMPLEWANEKGVHGEWNSTTRTIRLSVGVLEDEERLREILVHEMAHAAVYAADTDTADDESDDGGHDRRFLAELLRLLRAGAPINPLEFDKYGGVGWTDAGVTEEENNANSSDASETTCVYCGARVSAPLSSGLTRHWAMCASAPGFVRGEAKTTLKALIPSVMWVDKDCKKVLITLKRSQRPQPTLILEVQVLENTMVFKGCSYTDTGDLLAAVAARAEQEPNLELSIGAGDYTVSDQRVREVADLLAKGVQKEEA